MSESRWFRMDDSLHSDGVRVHMHSYRVLRETPKGVWLDNWTTQGRFVLRKGRKRWACPTEEEALESFKARKRKQIKILRRQLRRAATALAKVENFTYTRPS